MKRLTILMTLFFAGSIAYGQSVNSPTYDNEGFFANASLLGAAWTLDDVDIDAQSGAGFGVKLGYNFNTNFGLFASFDASNINPDNGENYLLGHFDIGGQGIFRSASDRVRPFIKASFVGMSAQDDDIEINGGGFGLGAGLYISLTEKLGFNVNYTHSWINISEVKIGSQTFDVEENATTGRFSLGLTYHF
ncbi:MAG: hypothetical protein EA412_00990 [Chitinophagaceae bacterium]|nr:MAG: hypothetical protein EA412_00990 [Chitinophagaceae bacterium]